MNKLVASIFSLLLSVSLIGCTSKEKLVMVMECEVCGDVLQEVTTKKDKEGLDIGSGVGFCDDCFAKEKEIIRADSEKVPSEEIELEESAQEVGQEPVEEPLKEPVEETVKETVKEPAKVNIKEETGTCEACGEVEVISKLNHLHGYGYFHEECYKKLGNCTYCNYLNVYDSDKDGLCNTCEDYICDRCGEYGDVANASHSPYCDDCEFELAYYDEVGCMCEGTTTGRSLAGAICNDCGTEYYLIVP